jgi:hypothetical protein
VERKNALVVFAVLAVKKKWKVERKNALAVFAVLVVKN